MVRTQIQLTQEQARRLRRAAREQGVSMAEVIRRCVDRDLGQDAGREDLWARAARVVGAFSDLDGKTDLAAEHDRYLDEAYR